MASTSGSGAAADSSTHSIDVDVEENARRGEFVEGMDEELGGIATSAAEGTQTLQSVNTAEPQDDSDLATSFCQNNSTKKHQNGSTSSAANAAVVNDEDDLMEPELPTREERLLDEKIRARYIQEIGDIF